MSNFNPVETNKAAMNFYLKRLGDVRNISENEIIEGISFFRNLYKNGDTAHYCSSGRNKLMTLAAHEANNIILGKIIPMKPLQENLEQKPCYEIHCTASGETDIILKRLSDNLNNMENHIYHPNRDRHTLLIIGNKNSTAYRIAEEIKEKDGDIAIIHYETSNKLKDSGNIFDAEGTIAEQQTFTILTSLGIGAKHGGRLTGYYEAMDGFESAINDMKYIESEPFEKMIDSCSDALNGNKIYLYGQKATRLIPEALKIHLDHAGVKSEVIDGKKHFTDTEIYIPYSRSGKIPLQSDAKRVHPMIAECAKPAMDTKDASNDNIIWIPNNYHRNVIPTEVDLWYKMHLLGDSSIAAVQKKHAIRNEELRTRHGQTLNDSHMFNNPTAKA